MAAMMESILRVYHLIFGESGPGAEGGNGEGGEEAVEMVEGSLEDEIETAQQERVRMAQEEVCVRARARTLVGERVGLMAVQSMMNHLCVLLFRCLSILKPSMPTSNRDRHRL